MASALLTAAKHVPDPLGVLHVRQGCTHMNHVFIALQEQVLSVIEQQCPFPYHNRRHTLEVIERVTALCTNAQPLIEGRDLGLLRIAALFHDYGHAGRTYRGPTGRDLSNEEWAVRQARSILQSHLNEVDLNVVSNMILATSFGQTNEKTEYYRPYKPVTLLEKFLAFADIAGFQKTHQGWMDENFAVLEEMDPEALRQLLFEDWIKGRRGFLWHCRQQLKEISPHLENDYALWLAEKLDEQDATLCGSNESYRQRFDAVRRSRLMKLQEA